MQTDSDLSAVWLDSMVGRAHANVAGAPKKNEGDPGLDRSRGGFSTKLHSLVDRQGRPLCLRVPGSQRHGST